MARAEGRNKDFSWMGVDPWGAFNPVPNIVNSESSWFDNSDVGSRMIKEMVLPRNCHTMCHSEETTVEFTERLCESLALVSHRT